MFGIGFPEMIVILVLIVLVVGPEQLPDVVRKGVSFLKEAKKHVSEIKSEIDKQTEPLRKPLEDMVAKAEEESGDFGMARAPSRFDNHDTEDHSIENDQAQIDRVQNNGVQSDRGGDDRA
ncbi:MAG: twin-arginine translocase TatA/TatE family subunit [Mariprofundaceae bacterium]